MRAVPYLTLSTFVIAVGMAAGAPRVLDWGTLVVEPGSQVYPVWIVSLVVLLVGALFSAQDLFKLYRESRALAFLSRSRDPDKVRARLLYRGTATVGRIASVERMRDAAPVTAQHARELLRGSAAIQLSGIGTRTRFLASSLLLLAVIGTFVGMKSALPQLADSVGVGTATGQQAVLNSLNVQQALRLVGAAFGANFIALLGALLLSITSFGALADKRRIYSEMERLSEEVLYARLPVPADAQAIERVVLELKRSLNDVALVAGSIGDLKGSINRLHDTLTPAIENLQSSFSDRFQRSLIDSQAKITAEIGGLSREVHDFTMKLGEAAVLYQGFVQGVEGRDAKLGELAADFAQGNALRREADARLTTQLTDITLRLVQGAEQLSENGSAIREMAGQTAGIAQTTIDALTRASFEIGTAVATQANVVETTLANAAAGIEASAARHAELMQKTLETATAELRSAAARHADIARKGAEDVAAAADSVERAGAVLGRVGDQLEGAAGQLATNGVGSLTTASNAVSRSARQQAAAGTALAEGAAAVGAAGARATLQLEEAFTRTGEQTERLAALLTSATAVTESSVRAAEKASVTFTDTSATLDAAAARLGSATTALQVALEGMTPAATDQLRTAIEALAAEVRSMRPAPGPPTAQPPSGLAGGSGGSSWPRARR
jgi:hypothetical protein